MASVSENNLLRLSKIESWDVFSKNKPWPTIKVRHRGVWYYMSPLVLIILINFSDRFMNPFLSLYTLSLSRGATSPKKREN